VATLEQTIVERWASKSALNALLSSTRVYVGNNSSASLPWVSLTRESGTRRVQSSANRLDTTTMRFEIYHSDYEKGRAIATTLAKQTTNGFHQDAFDITGDGRAVSMILENEGDFQDERGTWVFVVDFAVTYRRP